MAVASGIGGESCIGATALSRQNAPGTLPATAPLLSTLLGHWDSTFYLLSTVRWALRISGYNFMFASVELS